MKLAALATVVLALVCTSGIGFACSSGQGGGGCGSSYGGYGSHCPSSTAIIWETPSGTLPSAALVSCTLGLTPSLLTVVVTHLAPGQSCTFSATLANVGTTKVALTEAVLTSRPASCPEFTYHDNLPSWPVPTLGPGAHFPFQGVVSLGPTAANACQGTVAAFQVTITGTSQSTCDDELSAGDSFQVSLWNCD